MRYTVIFLSWISSNYLCMLRMSSSLGTPGECLHKFVFRTLHFVVRPEKPASEELCYRLISHIDPLFVCVGFLCQDQLCCTPRVRASYSTTDTFAQLLSGRLFASSSSCVSPVCSSGLDRPRTLHSVLLYCTVLHTVVLHCLLAVS